ncbi:MAG: M81 family metallopeptidase [Candidatus Tectomicrobia bacterium]
MSADCPRIAILGMHLEANAFAPVTTGDDFRASCYLEGEAMLAEAAKPAPDMPAEIPGFLQAMHASGPWEPVPILITSCEPGGPAEQAFVDDTLARMRALLAEAGQLDAIYVSNHGAMTATADTDPDGELYALARAAVGPDRPVVATVDLHANISDRMVDSVDVIVSYRTNPHVDQRQRAAEAARVLRRLLQGERWDKAFIRMPIAAPSVTLLTAHGAYADMIDEGQRHIGPELPLVSVVAGFAYADAPENGLAILAYGSGGKPHELTVRLAEMAWADRDRFRVQLTTLDDAIRAAVEAGRSDQGAAVCLADVADNPGGGGRGNTTDLLESLIGAEVERALGGNFVDPVVAARCHEAGVGARLHVVFNETNADAQGRAVPADIEVLALSDGNIVGRRGVYQGRMARLGPAAAIQIGGLTMVVCSRRIQCADPAFFETFGLDIGAYRSLTVKSRGHFRAGFDEFFAHEHILEVDADGLTTPMLQRFTWRGLPRPIWPLDLQTSWIPPRP